MPPCFTSALSASLLTDRTAMITLHALPVPVDLGSRHFSVHNGPENEIIIVSLEDGPAASSRERTVEDSSRRTVYR